MQADSSTPRRRGPRGPYQMHGPRTESVCSHAACGKTYSISQSDIDRGRGLYCSKKCARAELARPLAERFWKFVEKTDSCWIWRGYRDPYGYGQIRNKDGSILAHRIAYEMLKGPIPAGLDVCHRCPGGSNPSCVNPDHLEVDTRKGNMADARAEGRLAGRAQVPPENVPRGTRHHASKVTEDQVREMRARHAAGEKRAALAAEYGLSHSVAGDVFAFRSWKHVK